jgi:hypothetical protein
MKQKEHLSSSLHDQAKSTNVTQKHVFNPVNRSQYGLKQNQNKQTKLDFEHNAISD